jgi:hypothetical protein
MHSVFEPWSQQYIVGGQLSTKQDEGVVVSGTGDASTKWTLEFCLVTASSIKVIVEKRTDESMAFC